MLEGAESKQALARSMKFLLRSMVRAVVLYLALLSVIMIVGLVSLLTGWYPLAIEPGLLGLLGFTVDIDNSTNFVLSAEFNLVGLFVIVVAVDLLARSGSAVRSLRSSVRSWANGGP